MTFPRLYARYKDHPEIELLRGEVLTTQACLNLSEEMGKDWQVWIERECVCPVGRIRPTKSVSAPQPEGIDVDYYAVSPALTVS